jgi:hypothetical protein
MGEAGLAAYRQNFTAERMAEMAEAYYRSAVWDAVPPRLWSVMPDDPATALRPSTAAGRAA